MNWTAVGWGVGLLLVGVGVWIGLGALATWATAGARDGQDSERPRAVGKRH